VDAPGDFNMISRRQYFQLDDQPKLDGDRSFRGLKSYPDAGALEEGFLAEAANVRQDEKKVRVRRGIERKAYWGSGKAVLAAGRYANSYDATPADEIAIAIASEAYLYDPGAGTTTTVPYQSGQTTGAAEFLQAFGSLFLFRGRGASTPMTVPFTLGKYPLRYDGQTIVSPTDGGLLKMPKACCILQVHGPRLAPIAWAGGTTYVTDALVEYNGLFYKAIAGSTGQTPPNATYWLRIQYSSTTLPFVLFATLDLAPIEDRSKTFTFDAATGAVTSGPTGHGFEEGELIKITGTTSADGTWEVHRVDGFSVTLKTVPSPASNENQGTSPRPLCWSESATLTAADFGVMAGNRMALRADNNNVVFSALMSTEFIGEDLSEATAEMLSFNEGTSDYIVGLFPFQDDDMIVFKRNSIHLAPNLTALATGPTEITRQMGCAERKTIAGAGGLVFFLSDSGVYAIDVGVKGGAKIGTSAAHLSITDKPISEDIQDQIDLIDWANVGAARGVWYDNRYWLAIPESGSGGQAKKILLYNSILQAWESVDSLPIGVKEFLLLAYGGRQRLFIMDYEGTRYLVDSVAGADQYGTGGSPSTANVAASATTRAYDFDDLNQKRWLRAGVSYNTLDSAASSILVTPSTVSPAKILPTKTLTGTTAAEELKRIPVRGRGQSIQLKIDNQSGGRWELREVRVEGSIAGRGLQNYK
jgi:hypothetical protein